VVVVIMTWLQILAGMLLPCMGLLDVAIDYIEYY